MKSWQLTKIPRVAHFYFGGGKLLYMRYLTIKTFMKYNPGWRVVFWYPEVPFKGRSWYTDMYPAPINENICKDYFPEIKKLDIIFSPVDFASLGFRPNMAEVHKNDYIRVSALHLYGGLWSDMDIIYFKPVTELRVNDSANKDKEIFVCISDYGHSTGFVMSSEGNSFFEKLTKRISFEYKQRNYQCWGPDMWNKYYKHLESIPNSVNIDMDAVYAHNCHQVAELLNGSVPRFTEGSIGCHWYGGNTIWPDFFNKTAGGEKNLPDNLISKLIKNAQ